MAKENNIELLKQFLTDKPKVDFEGSKTFPDEEKIYTISGMKRFFRKNKLTNGDLDEAFNKLQNDKNIELFNVKVYNHTYDQTFPYFYITPVDGLDTLVKNLEEKSLQLKKENTKNISNIDNGSKTKKSEKVATTRKKK